MASLSLVDLCPWTCWLLEPCPRAMAQSESMAGIDVPLDPAEGGDRLSSVEKMEDRRGTL